MLDLDPGAYAAFIWPAYGLTAIAFLGMIASSLNHARRWRKRARELSRDREA
ncbi:heme exporter protein CcmD [Phenylobacterium sp.]|uniref:heme exporter protein CcmD n=1 Tax=Phenylobacterium sp. TaxID=1871053 RepID=UPI002718AA56|nr:heme exporter protein CcmD [Phenylobacterium sp.]MDO8379186.1 heme exporter protein CcmD [Phenylobacterium sp.]